MKNRSIRRIAGLSLLGLAYTSLSQAQEQISNENLTLDEQRGYCEIFKEKLMLDVISESLYRQLNYMRISGTGGIPMAMWGLDEIIKKQGYNPNKFESDLKEFRNKLVGENERMTNIQRKDGFISNPRNNKPLLNDVIIVQGSSKDFQKTYLPKWCK
tara:strand:- start:6067 stop:6537 length:471 start_codon:yes stop_codon:yes gene_type:complete